MAEAMLGPTPRCLLAGATSLSVPATISRRSDFWPCKNYVCLSRSTKGPRLIVDIHAEGSRDHDVPVGVGGPARLMLRPTSVVTDP